MVDPLQGSYQVKQAALTLGSGGLWGTGLGEGQQKLFFLPYPHTDFIFAATGEEIGFIGLILLLICFFLILAGWEPVTNLLVRWAPDWLVSTVASFSVMPHFAGRVCTFRLLGVAIHRKRLCFVSTAFIARGGIVRVPPLLMLDHRIQDDEELVHTGGQSHFRQFPRRSRAHGRCRSAPRCW